MSIFVLLIEIAAGGLLGLCAALLCAPWRLRGSARVGPAPRWDLSLGGAFGLVLVRVGSDKAGNGEDSDRKTGGAEPQDRRPVMEIRLAGIPVWRRGGDRGRTNGRPGGDRRRFRKASGSSREENRTGETGRKRSKPRSRLRTWLRILDKEWRQLARLALRRLLRTVRLRISVRGTYAAPDPAVTGWLAAAGGVLGTAGNDVLLLDAVPDFTASAPDLDISVEIRVVPVAALVTVLPLLRKKPVRKWMWSSVKSRLRNRNHSKEVRFHGERKH